MSGNDNSGEKDPPKPEGSRYYFYGTLNPAAGGWRFNEPIGISNGTFECEFTIQHGRFEAFVSGPKVDDITELVNWVTGCLQNFADALGYQLGASITVELRGGHAVDLATGDPSQVNLKYLWTELTGRDHEVSREDLDPFMDAALDDLLREALADLSLAISRARDTAFYCYRAVESVRNWVADRDGIDRDEKKSWPHLREQLRFTEDELKDLAKMSHPRRHGDRYAITYDERVECLTLAREVVNRAVMQLKASKEAKN